MNAWLLWLAISIVLGRIHHATSQDGESIELAEFPLTLLTSGSGVGSNFNVR